MKNWIKLLLGTAIGIVLAIFLSLHTSKQQETLAYLVQVVLHIGRYTVFGLVFFALAVGTSELREERKVVRVYSRTIIYMLLSTLLLVLIGTLSVIIIPIERIPIIIEEETVQRGQDIKEIILSIFPKNLFKVFITDGSFLFPIFFLAFFLGLNFNFDKLSTRPAVSFFDSMSRIFYHINSFIVEIFGIGMIILSIHFVKQIQLTQELQLFRQLLVILLINTGIILFGLYPALLYLFVKRDSPYKWLYAVIGPAVTAFLSRDVYFTLASLTKHGKESFGIPRRIGSATFPFFAMFGRAGTAMVTAVSFIVILTSYSSLGITFAQFLWVMIFSFLFSFTLAIVPGIGVFVALSSMCALYGRGIEEGYLILGAVMPILISFGVLLDVVTSAFASLLIAKHEDVHEEIEAGDFI